MKHRILSFLLMMWVLVPLLPAQDFTALTWQNDTTRLGISFEEAYYPSESVFPHYAYQFDLGTDYASRVYTVSIDYPEYQYINIPKGLEEQVKTLLSEPVADTHLRISAHQGILQASFVPLVYRDGKLMRINSFRLTINEGLSTRMTRAVTLTTQAATTSTYAANSLLAEGRWVKISIPQTGVFQLTDAKLREIGFTDPSKVRLYGYGGALLAENLRGVHPDDLCEVPLYRGNGYVLFYGQGPVSWTQESSSDSYFTRVQNFYATAGYYFLTEKEGTPAGFQSQNVSGTPASTVTSFSERALHEDESYNWATSGRELYEDYDYVNGNTRSYSFALTGVTTDPVHYTVAFAARHTSATAVNIAANGTQIGTFSIPAYSTSYNASYYKAIARTHRGTWSSGQTENTIVTLTHERPSGIPGRLNFIALNYRRTLNLTGSYLSFRDLNTVGDVVRYALDGTNASTQVWDVTTPGEYAQMQGTLNGSTYTFAGDNSTLREYVAVNVNGSFNTPAVIGEVSNQNLHALEQPDMVIIVPTSMKWWDQAERIAEIHREKDDMVVHIVSASQVYNEFSSGTPDATAYRWFMKLFYDRAANGEGKSPSYLLMMGDCSYDNRMLTSEWSYYSPDDFLLCYQSLNSTEEINSYVTDDYLGMLDTGEGTSMGRDALDIGVGRFPVRNYAEAKIAVDKTLDYINNAETGPWKNRVAYVADDEEGGRNNSFMIRAEEFSKTTESDHPEFHVNRIYQDAFPRVATAAGFSYPQATKRLLSLIDEGLLMVNYIGHGGTRGWSAENLLTISDIRAMRNKRLPLWVTATCDFCRYDHTDYSAGEEAFLNSNGGAVALFTTSRVVFSGGNNTLNRHFNNYIFQKENGKRLRLGDIMRLSKTAITTTDTNKLSFSLIGDPALMLGYPDQKIILDSFNDEPASSSDLKLRAGDIVTLKGHVEDASGTLLEGFEGLIYPTVFDRKEQVTCYNHIGAESVFNYEQYSNRLYAGSDSIRNGYFEITFPIPLDISYSDEQGMINLYASSNDKVEGQGIFDNFTVGGTAPGALETDSVGPDIWLYLNSPDFQSGGVVNPTPYLYAEIEDEEGINTTGSGIGHDITVSIDNSPIYTYVLNDYFQLSPGGYTKGTVQYQFDELPEGDHTLSFTAWDMKNNVSIYRLPFRVETGAAPTVSELSCYPVPAVNDITFHFRHNRPGSDLILSLEVFTFTGAKVWEYTFTDQTSTGYYAYTWDLTTEGGARLPQGVYLYRAHFSTAGSKETTETLKFVVAAQ